MCEGQLCAAVRLCSTARPSSGTTSSRGAERALEGTLFSPSPTCRTVPAAYMGRRGLLRGRWWACRGVVGRERSEGKGTRWERRGRDQTRAVQARRVWWTRQRVLLTMVAVLERVGETRRRREAGRRDELIGSLRPSRRSRSARSSTARALMASVVAPAPTAAALPAGGGGANRRAFQVRPPSPLLSLCQGPRELLGCEADHAYRAQGNEKPMEVRLSNMTAAKGQLPPPPRPPHLSPRLTRADPLLCVHSQLSPMPSGPRSARAAWTR